MPDMPQLGAAPAAAQEGPSIADAVMDVGQKLTSLNEMVAGSGAPDELKAALQSSLEAFTAFAKGAQGGGQPQQAPQAAGPATPEQGASGAVPMSHGGRR